MKLFGTIILAGLVSMLVGGVATLVLSALAACVSGACGLGDTQQLALMPFYALLGMGVFGVAATRSRWREAMFYSVRLLLLIPVVLIIVGLAADASPGAEKKFVLTKALQLALPFWAVVVSLWWMVRRFLSGREKAAA
ncbi:MAG: hypothetical protein J0G28_08105 [Afipia sp.]|nr:hypothetical protein [Afipia sp.]OJW62089.1 MAG: hypothetical protein BGO65_00575 [Afipia sp. 64-13]